MPGMKRREIITLLGAAAATSPVAARAQQAAIPVVGFLHSGSPNELARYVTAFLPARLHAHTHSRRTLCSRNFCDSQPSKAWLGADMAIPTYHSCCSLRGREFV